MSYRESRFGQQQTVRVLSNDSDTPKQRRARQDLDRASLGWTALDKPSKALWATYGATQIRKDPVTGRRYSLTGREAYMGLGSRFALVNPSATLPDTPPTVRFCGDTLTVALGRSGSAVTFTASAANAAGVKTEIMAQRLASADRTPRLEDYASLLFIAFDSAGEALSLTFAPGTWSFATRFVSATTGEASAVTVLGEATVALALVAGGADDLAQVA